MTFPHNGQRANSVRRALITGATSGIGMAFARALPSSTDLLLTGRNQQKLADLRRDLSRPGRVVETIAADLADEGQVHAVIDRAQAFAIDLLINNAGVGTVGPVLENPLQGERDTVAVNILAVVLLTRGLCPGMIERARSSGRRAGLIILSSTAAFAPVPFFATYAASKAFDLSFAEALAQELHDAPIDVLAVCPGATRTEFGARAGMGTVRIPGAADPADVARQSLAVLGQLPVKITGTVDQIALGSLLLPRMLVTGALGMAARALHRRFAGRNRRDPSPVLSPASS